MKKLLFLLINVMLLGIFFESFSQNQLWLMSGKKLNINSYSKDENNGSALLRYQNSNGKFKTMDMLDVYSVIDASGKEKIFKTNDTINGLTLNQVQLRQYLQGEYDAILQPPDYFAFGSSAAIGFISIFYPPFSKVFFFPVYPSSYVGILGLSSPGYEQVMASTNKTIEDSYYILGYKDALQRKRIKNGILGASAGIVTGVLFAIIKTKTN